MKTYPVLLPLLLQQTASQRLLGSTISNLNGGISDCGDPPCWCIPDEGLSCPTDIPNSNVDWIDTLYSLQQVPPNVLALDCDPYNDGNCETTPPQQDGEYCAIKLVPSASVCPQGYTYEMYTVSSSQASIDSDMQIVHTGKCGVCSTMQDLAVYMEYPDLSEIGQECGMKWVLPLWPPRSDEQKYQEVMECYAEYFTEPCAAIWTYNSKQTREKCPMCIQFALSGDPNNDRDTCELAECIQCDEDESGPEFKRIAGMTRRGAGLHSAIVRPCSSIADITQTDPCSTE